MTSTAPGPPVLPDLPDAVYQQQHEQEQQLQEQQQHHHQQEQHQPRVQHVRDMAKSECSKGFSVFSKPAPSATALARSYLIRVAAALVLAA